MRTSLVLILLLFLTSSHGQSAKSIKIFNCETGLVYSYSDKRVELRGTWFVPDNRTNFWYGRTIDSTAFSSFEKLFDQFARLEKRVVYLNQCINDGFNFKVYVQVDTTLQKIYVGNYYNKTIDSLTRLFDDQLEGFKAGFSFKISYGSESEIGQLIKWQSDCKKVSNKEYNDQLLDKWCEISRAR